MTEAQGDDVIELLNACRFFLQTLCLGIGILWGLGTWRLMLIAFRFKNFLGAALVGFVLLSASEAQAVVPGTQVGNGWNLGDKWFCHDNFEMRVRFWWQGYPQGSTDPEDNCEWYIELKLQGGDVSLVQSYYECGPLNETDAKAAGAAFYQSVIDSIPSNDAGYSTTPHLGLEAAKTAAKCFVHAWISGDNSGVVGWNSPSGTNNACTSEVAGGNCDGTCEVDTDMDTICDDEDDDDDNDGIPDDEDPCPLDALNECPACEGDIDNDMIPDCLDDDDDGDGCDDDVDNDPENPSTDCSTCGGPGQPCCDSDRDGCCDPEDPDKYDPEIGCEQDCPDNDNDGCCDENDPDMSNSEIGCTPEENENCQDSDGDGCCDYKDPDPFNSSVDCYECEIGFEAKLNALTVLLQSKGFNVSALGSIGVTNNPFTIPFGDIPGHGTLVVNLATHEGGADLGWQTLETIRTFFRTLSQVIIVLAGVRAILTTLARG